MTTIDTLTARLCAESYDSGDPWGSTMESLFAICEAMHHRGESIPDSWQFRHTMADSTAEQCAEENYTFSALLECESDITAAELVAEFERLDIVRAELVTAGKDY
jgi:hypothetical protein